MGISRRRGYYANCDTCDFEVVYEDERSREQVAERLQNDDSWMKAGRSWYCSAECAIKGEGKKRLEAVARATEEKKRR